MKTTNLMKSGILAAFLLCGFSATTIFAQNDTIYFMKNGVIVNKQSIKTQDVDSAIFFNPVTPTPPIQHIEITYVDIQGGTFNVGSETSELDRYSDEKLHPVILTAFRMSKYEITNAQYAAFLNAKKIGSNGQDAAGAYPTRVLIYATSGSYDWGLHYTNNQWVPATGYENHPVINVTWFGATEFATYVGAKLPTEAQFEYACRAGTTTPFRTGNCLNNTQAHYNWAYPYSSCTNTVTSSQTCNAPVGSYPANPWGLYDMEGNVTEWCSDRYGSYPTPTQTDPTGPVTGTENVFRGGARIASGASCRSAQRGHDLPSWRTNYLGFRVVESK